VILPRLRWLCLILLLTCAPTLCVASRVVVIDAGHGGHDRGGVPGQRISEKHLALDVALRVNRILRARRVPTIMTRSRDVFVSLPQRVAIGNRQRSALFVSIHFNSAPREGARGFETFYYNSRLGARLAYNAQRRLLRTYRTENRGVKRRGFYVLRHSKHPAVLIECGFLTNRIEGRQSLLASHRQRLAEAIAAAIIETR